MVKTKSVESGDRRGRSNGHQNFSLGVVESEGVEYIVLSIARPRGG